MMSSPDMPLSENIHPLQCPKCVLSGNEKGVLTQCSHRLPGKLTTPTSRCPLKVIDTNTKKMNSSLRARSKEPWEKRSTFNKGGKLVIVEGNIGVGKSTLTQRLADSLQYKMFLEPSTENPFLEKFYSDPHKYALKLQLWILKQRYLTYVNGLKHAISTGQGVILDRSVYSDCVFASVCHEEGFISNEGYEIYQYWRQRCLKPLPLPHVTIFLDATPQVCHKRIHMRARECESGVSLDYLQKLHQEYIKFINDIRFQGSQILQYDWSYFKDETIVSESVKAANRVKWTNEQLPSDDELHLEFPLTEDA